ncbi:ATP-binding SpoIIE family protein phosphatase [Pseudonocardia halophobica]|uniref:ATP-binding SpoIIE family protein phosphatase n=1 Tax=Pseudonocardia halophobica TaxID=29401 RepID=UPI0018CBF67F|nr:SpoIIE family protein phosphatase [Pseudonocardia halophobica]
MSETVAGTSTGPDALGSSSPRVLLVEDDDGDAFLVEELLAEVGEIPDLLRVSSIAEATGRLGQVDCVLLDMNLPDSSGLDGLARLLEVVDHPAVVVLTGDLDETRGRAAVAAGAEDYLIKGKVNGRLLTRAVQYAVERRRADRLTRQLQEARAQERENRRLGRGLLPTALLRDPALTVTTRYQPGEKRLLLGGDFYDAIETDDGTVHVIIGDVSGHGPDEAAIGVSLRIAWRTLILAGMPAAHVLPILDQVLVTERHDTILFTTVAMVSVAADRSHVDLYLAGHPPPLLIDGVRPRPLPDHALGVPLGVRLGTTWPSIRVPLPANWALLLYTDGLVEARDDDGEVLWTDGLLDLLGSRLHTAGPAWDARPDDLLDALLAAVDRRAPLRGDDLAVALITHIPAEARQRAEWAYDPTPGASVRVRRDLLSFLSDRGIHPDTTDDALLVASELASNAVDHARTRFGVAAALDGRSLRLEVTDGSPAEPLLQVLDVHAPRGRGLQMVDTLATEWTVRHHETGKTVVAEIAITTEAVSDPDT